MLANVERLYLPNREKKRKRGQGGRYYDCIRGRRERGEKSVFLVSLVPWLES